ncbi:MAG TPA: DUF5985 family protein [Longimicrobiaceae bacterium]|nr:DUF5985 family protein [Longimicrobiaceae bacterium]
MISSLVAGAIAMGYFVAGLFFLKFWRATRDRLFLAFCVAFAMLAVQRVALVVVDAREAVVLLYGLRLLAFLVIIAAVVDKNRPSGR